MKHTYKLTFFKMAGFFQKKIIVFLVLFYSPFSFLYANPKINVVTTTTDLRYIAEQIGRDRIRTISLIRGFDDPHFVMTRPDYLVKLNRADVFCMIGLDLEVGWVPLLLEQSRNMNIQKGQAGHCDASVGIKILGKPTIQVDRSMGDMHIFGNPHYWYDPLNAVQMARTIADSLSRVDPENKLEYQKNYNEFKSRIVSLIRSEMKKMEPYFGSKVAVFHDEFLYLANRFRFNANLTLEERPGVPPSNRYLERVVRTMNTGKTKVILLSPVNNPKYAEYVSSKVPGSVVMTMPTSVEALPEAKTYEDMIRISLAKIRRALDDTGTRGK